ncbi:alginate export family protein [Sphingomonas dokdonensis]|uniref:alginate export family protein n=1 Tax=Sphingomonas dokdonensis TaxID=344880 RepID=UPI000B4B78DE|nr:alginate export family protein [Sphingomonas dokdonensis]
MLRLRVNREQVLVNRKLSGAGLRTAGAVLLLAFSAAPTSAQEAAPSGSSPQEALTIQSSYRSRVEVLDGQARAVGPTHDFMWSHRAIVFAEYETGVVRVGGELRDARAAGERRNSTAGVAEVNSLEPVQAYLAADLGPMLAVGGTTSLTAGRFTMELSSGRQIATPEFANSVNSFVGAQLMWSGLGQDQLMAFWTMPGVRLPNTSEEILSNKTRLDHFSHALVLSGLSFTKAEVGAGAAGEIYLLRLNEHDTPGFPTRDRHLTVVGVRTARPPAPGKLDFEVELIRQTGHVRATARPDDLRTLRAEAYLIHAEIGRRGVGHGAVRPSLHFDLATGDDRDLDKWSRFDPLFGGPRGDFGPTSLYGAVTRSNIVSAGARVEVAPSKRTDGAFMTRALWLHSPVDSFAATGVQDRSGHSGRWAGIQFEGRVRHWIIPRRLRAEGGAVWLVKGRFLRDAPNVAYRGDSRYGYFDLTLSI